MKSKRLLQRSVSFLLIWACIITCLFAVGKLGSIDKVYAEDNTESDHFITSEYVSTLFTQENGLGSNEVNCVYQTASGYIWVGTDGGLYRYDGNEFKVFNLWDTEKDDVYCINSLFQDSRGRLWIATNNYGLFYKKGNDMHHFSSDYYNGIKVINDVCESSDGAIYVAASNGLFKVDEESLVLSSFEDLSEKTINKLESFNDKIWGISDRNEIFNVSFSTDGTYIVRSIAAADLELDELTCLESDDEYIYAGTLGGNIIRMTSLSKVEKMPAGSYGINALYKHDKTLYVCTDNGLGYIGTEGGYHSIVNMKIDSYISSMIFDYEGSIWISSNRNGLLHLGMSKFDDFTARYRIPENSVNCIKQVNSYKYVCTDEGLYIIDYKGTMKSNSLTEVLSGVGVNNVIKDSNGNVWVSTFRRYGVIKWNGNGSPKFFGRSANLPSNQINSIIELSNGKIAVATSEGIGIISDDEVEATYTVENGLDYPNITCLAEDDRGRIIAGSDGGGIYIINGKIIKNYTTKQGLTSDVVSCIEKGESGFYIGTDNGISYYGDTVRALSSIDFSNNVYDVVKNNDDVWVIGSKGILRTSENELLGANGISSRYLARGDGLVRSITNTAGSMIDDKGILYICCTTGIETLDTNNIKINEAPPRLTVSEIDVDGKVYSFDEIGGSLTIPAKTNKITITFGVMTYVNRDNLEVSYNLEGFDSEHIVISGNSPMQAVYTNLEGGDYDFSLFAVNADGTKSESTMTFTISKEFGFFERKSVRITLAVFLGLLLFVAAFVFFKFRRTILGKNRELERLTIEHENAVKSSTAKNDYLANISNEIKIPINAIISLAENTMNSGSRTIEEQENLKNIVVQSNDIISKVDGIIRLARLESGREVANNAPYSITTLVCDLSDRMINLVDNRPIKFFVELGNDIPDVLIGDYEKIKAVLMYLLDNAQKYTREGSITLTVDCYEYNDPKSDRMINLVFGVADTGIGIRNDRLDHIFEVYNINSNKQESGYPGTGIGLAIAKKLSEVMGGDIDVESNYGVGSTFTFSIIQKRPEGSVYQAQVDADVIELVSMEEAEQMWAPEVSILFVDDVELNTTVAVGITNQMEIKCDTASSGINAIDMVMNNDYDLVFMDMIMPVMNGTDTMKEIRELGDPKYDKLPIIAMTENVISEDREKLINDGFTDVILKPLDRRTLATIIINNVDRSKVKYKTSDMSQYIKESRYSEGLERLSENLEVTKILEKIGGNIDVYNKILSSFYSRNKNVQEELRIKFESDYRNFRNRIHGIRTSSGNIGAVNIANMASTLESAVNIGNKTYVRDNLDSFLLSMQEIVYAIGDYLAFVDDKKGITDTAFEAGGIENEKNADSEITSSDAVSSETVSDDNLSADTLSSDIPEDSVFEVSLKEEAQETEEKEQDISDSTVDIDALMRMDNLAVNKDIDEIRKEYDDLMNSNDYSGDDMDFLSVLGENIKYENFENISELVHTYIDLKS
ncbi:Signal transduction histidine kinase [Eubacterium ruminantium]|nr:Signal transduction histidine kinase [Eubacterium ruminantium]